LCQANYLRFFTRELIPAIEQTYPVRTEREARTVLGVSHGGRNAACFGLLGYETFSGIGMHSPANSPIKNLLPAYEKSPRLPLRIFLGAGSFNDNTSAKYKFRKVLGNKGYDMKFVQSRKRHNWDNWRPLIDDALVFFYGEPAVHQGRLNRPPRPAHGRHLGGIFSARTSSSLPQYSAA